MVFGGDGAPADGAADDDEVELRVVAYTARLMRTMDAERISNDSAYAELVTSMGGDGTLGRAHMAWALLLAGAWLDPAAEVKQLGFAVGTGEGQVPARAVRLAVELVELAGPQQRAPLADRVLHLIEQEPDGLLWFVTFVLALGVRQVLADVGGIHRYRAVSRQVWNAIHSGSFGSGPPRAEDPLSRPDLVGPVVLGIAAVAAGHREAGRAYLGNAVVRSGNGGPVLVVLMLIAHTVFANIDTAQLLVIDEDGVPDAMLPDASSIDTTAEPAAGGQAAAGEPAEAGEPTVGSGPLALAVQILRAIQVQDTSQTMELARQSRQWTLQQRVVVAWQMCASIGHRIGQARASRAAAGDPTA